MEFSLDTLPVLSDLSYDNPAKAVAIVRVYLHYPGTPDVVDVQVGHFFGRDASNTVVYFSRFAREMPDGSFQSNNYHDINLEPSCIRKVEVLKDLRR